MPIRPEEESPAASEVLQEEFDDEIISGCRA
jgi:hypothetical protein